MKKLLFLVCLLSCISLYSMAEETVAREGDFCYRIVEDGALLVDWINWTDETAQSVLVIPNTLGGFPVVGIGSGALETCDSGPFSCTFEIVIPEGVIYLNEYAFECCSNASKYVLPSTLERVPESSFIHSSADVVFPRGNPFFTVQNGFFIDNRTQTLLYSAESSSQYPLPSVSRLGSHSLDNYLCDKATLCLPETVTSIGAGVFYDLPDLISLILPDGLEQLSSYSFNAVGLEKITLPASLVKIPPYCFVDCAFSEVVIPDGVESIGEYAFYYNWDIAEVTLPESMHFVGYNAFPEECNIVTMNPDTHFESLEEFKVRCPDGEW